MTGIDCLCGTGALLVPGVALAGAAVAGAVKYDVHKRVFARLKA